MDMHETILAEIEKIEQQYSVREGHNLEKLYKSGEFNE